MRTILSKIFYYFGDLISKLFHYNFFCKFSRILYPMYDKLMIWSSRLDKYEKVWKNMNDEQKEKNI